MVERQKEVEVHHPEHAEVVEAGEEAEANHQRHDWSPIAPAPPRKAKQDAEVTEKERSQLRTLIGELSWPAREAYPEFAYDASDIQQRVTTATVGTLLRANAVLKQMRARADQGPALKLPAGDRSGNLRVMMMTDASWNRQPKSGSQQGHVIAFGNAKAGPQTRMCIASWSSTKIKRVVRSTLAAEAAALAGGYDMAVYMRVLLARLLGKSAPCWAEEARQIPQTTWIDCKSLDEMLHKSGGTASEKRVALDVHDVQQFMEDEREDPRASDLLKWISTTYMLADPLTKPIPSSHWTALADFLATGLWKMSGPATSASSAPAVAHGP